MNQSAEPTTSYSPWTPSMASCDITPPDPTPTVSTDNVVYRETYATAGWQKGLTTNTKVLVNGVQRKSTDITWTQDDTNATYQINPRIIDTTVHDSENHHRRSSTSYYTFTLPSGVSCSLPQDVTSYQANTTTPLRTTRIEYNVSTDYTSRRIIGLPSFTYTYEGGISAANLRSKVGYLYDEPSNLSDTFLGSLPSSATQHDGTNYGTGFIWRGNANRVRKYEVNQLTGALSGNYLESRIGYKVTGSVAYAKDGLGHVTTTSYTDSFFQSVNRSNPSLQTFAYPTTVTDPDNFSATTAYNYDMGVMTQSTDPKNAIMKTRYDTAGRPEHITRRDGVNSVDKGYTSLVYPASMNLVQTYMLTDATKPEAYSVKVLDGAGRVRATAAEHLGSTGGYAAQFFDFDAAGQIARQSKPTETNASGGTWAALGDDDPANGGSGWVYSVQAYDWKGRPTVTTNTADSTSRTISYDGCGCAGGEVSTLTDEVGNRQRMTADILGRQFKVEDLNTDASVYRTTTTTYNARDQITQSVDQEGTSGAAQTTTTEYDGYGRVWKTRPPQANASTVFAYNADDSVNVQTDARGATATYSYNNRGMTTGVTYALASDVWSVSFGYDSVGNRTSMTDGMGPVSYSYDTVSRLTSETRTFSETGRSFTTTYDYNLADELTLVTDHFGSSVTYTRDRAGRLTDMPGYTTGIKYRAWGAPKEQTLTNGKVVSIGYNARMQMSQFNVPGITGWQYQYNGDGSLQFSSNLQTLGTRDERLDRKLVYDQVGRLSQGLSGSQARGEATFPATGPYRQNLGNDVWDHLTFRDNQRGSVYNSYSASYLNNKNQNTGWQYDANGSLTRTQEGTSITQYTYNCASHLTSAVMTTSSSNTTILYGYDGDGQRVKKIETNAPTTYYVRSSALGGQVLDEVDASGAKLRGYVYQEGRIIAKQEGAGTQWDVRDPANNSNFMLDAAGASVSHVELDPLGTTVDPNNPSYSQNPMGFYGGPGLQGTYCRVNNLGISVPCSLAQMLNGMNFGATVTINGDQVPLSMAQGMAEIGYMGITQQDILFGNPWDLQNMRLTFREPTHYKAGVVGVGGGPAPPQITGSSRPSLRDYYFNWGAYAAGYLWMDGYGADHPTEGHDAVVKGAFVRSPQRSLFTTEELVAGARDIIENAAAPCAKLLGKNALAKFDKISGNITFNGDAPILVDNGGGPQGAKLGSVGYIDAVTNGQTVSLNPNGNSFNNVSKGGSGTHILQGVFDKFGVTQRQFAIAVIIHEFLHTTGKFGKDYKLKPDGTIDASKSVRNQERVLKDCFPP
jgi:YD repeat-containing protein